jgi:hypothetical protein
VTPFRALLMIAFLSVTSTALLAASQQPPPNGAKPNPDKELSDEEQGVRRAAEKLVGEIDVEIQSDDKWTKVKRIEKPLLFFGDDTRGHERGSLWAWGDKGRPIGVLELFQNTGMKRWEFGLTNTSGGKLRASRAGEPWWQENESDIVLKDVPGASAPAAGVPQRLRQLKLLSQKFTGHEIVVASNSRFELRRIERPVHTYRDEEHGLLEGGLIILANGTNPEILLFLEARADPKDRSKAVWQFLVGRAAGVNLHLAFDGKEVFDAPPARRLSGPTKPFWIGHVPTESNTDPKK